MELLDKLLARAYVYSWENLSIFLGHGFEHFLGRILKFFGKCSKAAYASVCPRCLGGFKAIRGDLVRVNWAR